MDIAPRFIIHETAHWILNHHMSSALPGYLVLGTRHNANSLSDLPEQALVEMGTARTVEIMPDRVVLVRDGETVVLSCVEWPDRAARDAGIPYIEVSGKLQHLRATAPELSWFAADDIHPGRDLALLNALLVYQTIHGALPQPGPLTVAAPIYGSTSGLDETLRSSDAPPPLETTPIEVHYDSAVLERLLATMVAPGGD